MEYINKNLLLTEQTAIERHFVATRSFSWGEFVLKREDTPTDTCFTLSGPCGRKVSTSASVMDGHLYLRTKSGVHIEKVPSVAVSFLGDLVKNGPKFPDQADVEKMVMDRSAKRFGPRLIRTADSAKVVKAEDLRHPSEWLNM